MMCWTACGSPGNPRHPTVEPGEEKPLVEAAFSQADERFVNVCRAAENAGEPVAPVIIVSRSRGHTHPGC